MTDPAFQALLHKRSVEGNLRSIPASNPDLIDFTSNDYLGLAKDYSCLNEVSTSSMTSSASRLLSAEQKEYRALEGEISCLYGRPALLFNSGFHANTGCIPALALDKTLFVADKLCHASMIDGLILSRAPFLRFPHNDLNALYRIVEKHINDYDRIIVLTESVFSMDGDFAPLEEIADLRDRYQDKIITYVDEAHGVGVFGEHGLGLTEELGLINRTDLIVGTFGKALASYGAFVVTSEIMCHWLLNSARSFIFSTAIPPAVAAHSLEMLKISVDADARRSHLQTVSQMFRDGLAAITNKHTDSSSQIVPWIIGNSNRAIEYSEGLRENGIAALPIRRPTVPAGTERIRFSLSASHSAEDVRYLLTIIRKILIDK